MALFFSLPYFSQVANYVSNGSLEDYWSCNVPNDILLIKNWRSIDSLTDISKYYSTCPNIQNVPSDGSSYQIPRHGFAYLGFVPYCLNGVCNANYNRSYVRNRLKSPLVASKVYCVKFYVNLRNPSTHGIDGIGAFFCSNLTLDTITKPNIPLVYLNPQVQNPNGNIITDTLNWVLISGTFTANGTESNLLVGNFKSNAATNTTVINAFPIIETDMLLDEVSCIPLDLPAYAAPSLDIWAIPGTTTYIGRPQDVGIDEACTWFKLPNTTSVIANAAGMTLTVAVGTETYMVKQDICGVIKYDTVVVHASGVGIVEWQMLNDKLQLFPNPANDLLNIECSILTDENLMVSIINNLGQLFREEEISFKNRRADFNVKDLPQGVYTISVKNKDNYTINRRVVISR